MVKADRLDRDAAARSARQGDDVPNYLLLLHDTGTFPDSMSPADIQAVIQRYVSWRELVQRGGRRIEGHKLVDGTGRVMRGSAGSPKVTDGPYAEAREVIGGLFIVEAANYEEVVALCRDCPHLDFGTIEIREVQPTG
jgi:hypothetical protein